MRILIHFLQVNAWHHFELFRNITIWLFQLMTPLLRSFIEIEILLVTISYIILASNFLLSFEGLSLFNFTVAYLRVIP